MTDGLFKPPPTEKLILTGGSEKVVQPPPPFVSEDDAAEVGINEKWISLGGAPGEAIVPGISGLMRFAGGFYREYDRGRIYLSEIKHTPYHVFGAIGVKYTELGGPGSWLGWPTSDEQPFADEGRVSSFQNGAIYWWPDTGAIELGDVTVVYTGLYCYGETDDQLWSGSLADEPYVIFATVPAFTDQSLIARTRVYDGVDKGDSREDNIELYRGLPYGLSVTAILMEHDQGDPDKYREEIKQGVDLAAAAVVLGLAAIPKVGPALAVVAAPLLNEASPHIAKEVNKAIGLADDHIGTVAIYITPKDMVRLTRVQPQFLNAIPWHLDSPLISGDGGSYKVYMQIQAA